MKTSLELISLTIIAVINLSFITSFNLDCGDQYKCSLTAVCAENYLQCPTPMECPTGFTKCNMFTCSKYSEDTCEETACEKITCWDNSCADKRDECPSVISCSETGSVRCSDNSCVSNKDECAEYKECPNFIPYKCSNGDCKKNEEDCPKLITCPVTFPYLCNDGSCKQNKGECTESETQTTCADNSLTRCADGTCTSAQFLCPTLKTCPVNMVLCYNGVCANSVEDCFSNQQVLKSGGSCSSSAKIMCPYTSTCVDYIEDCPTATICPLSKPVKCWDGSCKESITKCASFSKCPESMIECPDGSCASSTCGTLITCSVDAPYKCLDNTCKKNPLDCPEVEDCPEDNPYFCWDGTCKALREDCTSTDACNTSAPVKCPDNMCRGRVTECSAIDTCPTGFTYISKSGICSSNYNDEDSLDDDSAYCPQETPIKCLDGLCVRSHSYCRSSYVENLVENNKFRCANGIIVENGTNCQATYACEDGKIKCDDNTCVDSRDKCSGINTCPSNIPHRCSNGMCALDSNECLNSSGCPVKHNYKCQNTGLCVSSVADCKSTSSDFPLANGCTSNTPLRCTTGQINKCVSKLDDCEIEYCTNPEEPVFCGDSGQCAANFRACLQKPTSCDTNQVTCPDKSCKSSLEECNNQDGCPMQRPFRCLDGTCKKFPTLWNPDGIDEESCDIGIKCPDYKPYLCADGSCVEKTIFCSSLHQCTSSKPNMCFDRSCSSKNCSSLVNKCPLKNPILCPINGKCVDTIFDCFEHNCPNVKPIKCASGICTNSPQECQITSLTCEDNEFTCYDGSCRAKESDCPKYKGCSDFDAPYKCLNGSCQIDKESCTDDIDLTKEETNPDKKEQQAEYRAILEKLSIGKVLCEDGIYRSNCPSYNGCNNKKPLLCSNGFCVADIAECAGISNCNLDTPFRCIDGTCESEISSCPKIKKLQYYDSTTVFVHRGSEYDLNMLVSDENEVIGSLYIPNNNFLNENEESVLSYLKYKVHAKSIFSTTKVNYDQTRRDDIVLVYPFGDQEETYSLEYEYSILSPVIEILSITENNISNSLTFKSPLSLSLAYDFPELKDDNMKLILDPHIDLCLGVFNSSSNSFTCTDSTIVTTNFSFRELIAQVSSSGYYAVILNPKADNTLLEFEENFIMENFIILSIVFGSLLIVFIVGFYVFIRIYRYREKYKFTRQNTQKIENQMQEMQNLGSSHLGQTIGDSIDNIIYTDNPFYKVTKAEEKSARIIELEDLYFKYQKRHKQLETNSNLFDKKIEMLSEEIDRLNEYKRIKNEEMSK